MNNGYLTEGRAVRFLLGLLLAISLSACGGGGSGASSETVVGVSTPGSLSVVTATNVD